MKNLIPYILLGSGALLLLSNKNAPATERRFRLPDGSVVAESQLESLGYIYYSNYWIAADELNRLSDRFYTGEQWKRWITLGFAIGDDALDVLPTIERLIRNNSNNFSPPIDENGLVISDEGGLLA